MRSDAVKKGTQQAPQRSLIQCAWNDRGRDGQTTGRNRKFLQ